MKLKHFWCVSMIYLVRHGETEWNVARRYQGRQNSRLTEKGRRQGADMAALLHRLLETHDAMIARQHWRLVSSPLGRAVETAEIIAAILGLSVEVDERVTELTAGSWDGRNRMEIDAESPGLLEGVARYEWFLRSPDGESFEAATARLAEWLDEVGETPVILVTHSIAGRVLRAAYAGLPRDEALVLPVPQDGLFRLANREIGFHPGASS